jgi:hypothetical protein
MHPKGASAIARQRSKLGFLGKINRDLRCQEREDNTELDARIRAYELAFRMQAEAPEAVDLTSESEATKKLYGIDDPKTAVMGRNCLLARRLVERGVRFMQLYHGSGSKWDAHDKIEENHTKYCGETGQARGRSAARSEIARTARRDARHLGRRIRPHAHE